MNEKEINGVENLAAMFGCDTVFVEDMDGMAVVEPMKRNEKFSCSLITSYDEVFAAKVKKATSNDPNDAANKKLSEYYS